MLPTVSRRSRRRGSSSGSRSNQKQKLTPDDPKGKAKLFYLCCLYGSAKDVVALFEELRGTPLGQAAYEDVIARCLYLGDREKAPEITEELATSRLWFAAADQVRPMNFFENPNLREFLLEPESSGASGRLPSLIMEL